MLFSDQPLSSRTIGGYSLGRAIIVESKASIISLVSHVDWNGNAVDPSGAINTSGATLLVMSIGIYLQSGAPAPVPSDSYGNTWTLAIQQGATDAENQAEYLFYVANPTVGTGHTFTTTITGNQGYPSQQVAAFKGITTTSPLDQTSGFWAGSGPSASTIQPGSLTPSQNDCLIITNEGNFCGTNSHAGATVSVNLGFTIIDQDLSTYGSFCGSALAYLVQATSTAVNPTWTLSSTLDQYDYMSNLAIFKGVIGTDNDTVGYTYFHGSIISEAGNASDSCSATMVRKAVIHEGSFAVGFSGSAMSSRAPGTSDGVYSRAQDTTHIGQISAGMISENGNAVDTSSGQGDPTLGMFLLAP